MSVLAYRPCVVEDDASRRSVSSPSPAGHQTAGLRRSPAEVTMSMIAPSPASIEPDVEPIDLDCHSVRDFLNLIAAVRQTKPRDPLRALEDVLLDLVGEA